MLLEGQAYDKLRYKVVPPLFLGFFTSCVQLLTLLGRSESITYIKVVNNSFGNCFSWKIVTVFIIWCIFWLKVPSKRTAGPATNYGSIPTYQDNGLQFYFYSIGAFIMCHLVWPNLSLNIYENTPQMLGTLNIIALLLCIFLYTKGKIQPDSPEEQNFPQLYLFYRGIDLHPKIWGIDIKQLTNCRIGLMGWQILVLSYFLAGTQINGFSLAFFTNVLLQSIYLAIFFDWEGGYFHTLDIILDRAGYYLCWGCLVWVPCFYTYSSYYLVHHSPIISNTTSVMFLICGLISIIIKCVPDYEKMFFRKSDGNFKLWGKPAKFIIAKYKDHTGKESISRLLISGTWGVARHFNYTFELFSALFWCLPALGVGYSPFFYFFFLFFLLVHRIFRDEEKCSKKYGQYWNEYCSQVPYRLIPYIF